MKYVASTFKLQFLIVVIAIIISAIAGMAGPLFLLFLIDDFITPMIGQQNPDFTSLGYAVAIFAVSEVTPCGARCVNGMRAGRMQAKCLRERAGGLLGTLAARMGLSRTVSPFASLRAWRRHRPNPRIKTRK